MLSHDDQLIALLSERDVHLSRRRLHRWRLEHVFPANPRGRPRRDAPAPNADVIELAAFLAEHLRPGRGIEPVALFAFGRCLPLPELGGRKALSWCARSTAETTGVGKDEDERWDAVEAASLQMSRIRDPLASEMRRRLALDLREKKSPERVDSVLQSTYATMLLAMSGMDVSPEGISELFTAMGYTQSLQTLGLDESEMADAQAQVRTDIATVDVSGIEEVVKSTSWEEICSARDRVVRWLDEVEANLGAIEADVPGAFGLPLLLEPTRRPIVVATHTLLSLGASVDPSTSRL